MCEPMSVPNMDVYCPVKIGDCLESKKTCVSNVLIAEYVACGCSYSNLMWCYYWKSLVISDTTNQLTPLQKNLGRCLHDAWVHATSIAQIQLTHVLEIIGKNDKLRNYAWARNHQICTTAINAHRWNAKAMRFFLVRGHEAGNIVNAKRVLGTPRDTSPHYNVITNGYAVKSAQYS